jgi:hypothetical protein
MVGVVALSGMIVAALSVSRCGSSSTPSVPSAPSAPTPAAAAAPQCDASLWSHVYLPSRLTVMAACQTMTGIVVSQHTNDDGDIDMRVSPDAPFLGLLNAANQGTLQVEAICQTTIEPNRPQAAVSCKGFTGTVQIPPVGALVQVTGTHVLDTNHGWMEIHPASVITIVR